MAPDSSLLFDGQWTFTATKWLFYCLFRDESPTVMAANAGLCCHKLTFTAPLPGDRCLQNNGRVKRSPDPSGGKLFLLCLHPSIECACKVQVVIVTVFD